MEKEIIEYINLLELTSRKRDKLKEVLKIILSQINKKSLLEFLKQKIQAGFSTFL